MAKKRSRKSTEVCSLRIGEHIRTSFWMIFANLEVYGLLFVTAVIVMGLVVGFPSLETVITSSMIGLMVWLLAIFFARQIKAGKKVSFRDGLYNAMTPLISTVVVLAIIAVQLLPVIVTLVAYASAVETNLFQNFGYGLMFAIFAGLMVWLSAFLLTPSIMSLVAVSAPGLYPIETLGMVRRMMKGKKIKFWGRMAVMALILVAIWAVILVPVVLVARAVEWVDVTLVSEVTIVLLSCFSIIFAAVYLYIYYRGLIDGDKK